MNDKIIHKMTMILLSVILLIPLIKVEAQTTSQNQVVVNVGSLKVRTGPGLTYDIIGVASKNDELDVIGKENDWLQVKFGNTTGWVASWYTTNESVDMTNKQVVSKVNQLNVRTEPSTASAVIGQLNEGNRSTSYKSEGDWIEIDFQGSRGWVNQEYVTVTEQSNSNSKPTPSKEKTFVVSVDILNVRKKPDLSSRKIGQVEKGDEFEVLSVDHNWVQVQLKDGKKGWLYSFYGNLKNTKETSTSSSSNGSITILYNGTNLRSDSTTSSAVVKRADAGESYKVLETINDWYKIALADQSTAYVASWLVSTSTSAPSKIETSSQNTKESTRKEGTLEGLSIVIDAGHGGNDRGTTGALGTDEKNITLLTAELLSSKLQAAGANVIMTRESDKYVDLRKRVSIGHQVAADAFISLHYDAIDNSSVRGFTTYYMHGYQKELARSIHKGLGDMIELKDRGVQPGNYLVLRENKQAAVLIELGFLSNPTEERNLTTQTFREQATHGIYNGIIEYFDSER